MIGRRVATLAVVSVLGSGSAGGQVATDSGSAYDRELAVAVLRVAMTHGQLTSHATQAPDVVCLARTVPKPAVPSARYDDPDSTVVGRLRSEARGTTVLRPVSACRIEPLERSVRHRSLVVDTLTGRRGIVVWMAAPTTDASGRLSVDVGYYEHGLSAAHWRCAVRRDKGAWVVNACAMLSIS